jgi:hypothetical protein
MFALYCLAAIQTEARHPQDLFSMALTIELPRKVQSCRE